MSDIDPTRSEVRDRIADALTNHHRDSELSAHWPPTCCADVVMDALDAAIAEDDRG